MYTREEKITVEEETMGSLYGRGLTMRGTVDAHFCGGQIPRATTNAAGALQPPVAATFVVFVRP